MAFLFTTGGHVDGFQFAPDDNGCVRFHITVDERPQPNLIHIGQTRAHPSSAHFVACP
jgi:hypothetical protein